MDGEANIARFSDGPKGERQDGASHPAAPTMFLRSSVIAAPRHRGIPRERQPRSACPHLGL